MEGGVCCDGKELWGMEQKRECGKEEVEEVWKDIWSGLEKEKEVEKEVVEVEKEVGWIERKKKVEKVICKG